MRYSRTDQAEKSASMRAGGLLEQLRVDKHKSIDDKTRDQLLRYMLGERKWNGVFNEADFLSRIYSLDDMPSRDHRPEYNTARLDIHQHRVRNQDWEDDWVFYDERFNLRHGPDDNLLRFLVETVHESVRPDRTEARQMVADYNQLLQGSGWELFESPVEASKSIVDYRRIEGAMRLSIELVRSVEHSFPSSSYVRKQIQRLEEALENSDNELAIGTAKELLETVCHTILRESGSSEYEKLSMPALVRRTADEVEAIIGSGAAPEKTVTAMVRNLVSIGNNIAEMRNMYGTGHGKHADHVGLERRHAKLAVGAAALVIEYLAEAYEVRRARTQNSRAAVE